MEVISDYQHWLYRHFTRDKILIIIRIKVNSVIIEAFVRIKQQNISELIISSGKPEIRL